MSQARNLHSQAEILREKGNFLEALEYTDKATIVYQEEGDLVGLAEVQASRFITLKHLYQLTEDKNFLILAKHSAMAGVEIARVSGKKEALAIPLQNLGEAYDQLAEYQKAQETYRQAVEYQTNYPSKFQNRPAVLANLKAHLYIAEFKAGDQTALDRARDIISELEKDQEEDSYNKNAWLTGAHMRLAEILPAANKPEEAREHLEKAREIIDSDKRLVLRKKQWEKLEKLINS